MPFTPSHAVVALPFVRTPLVPAAIAVGAMTPDLPLFVRGVGLSYAATHDLRWLPGTVLLAFALLLAWRCILRPGVRELLPDVLAARLPARWDDTAAAGWRETVAPSGRVAATGLAVLAASLAIGVASHIMWDLFTHEGRWGTVAIPALGALWGPLPGYRWLQHGSTLVAGAVLVVWGTWWLARRRREPVVRVLPTAARVAVWVSLPVFLGAAAGWGLAVHGPLDETFTLAHLGYLSVPPACAAWGVLVAGACATVPVVRARRAGGSDADQDAVSPA